MPPTDDKNRQQTDPSKKADQSTRDLPNRDGGNADRDEGVKGGRMRPNAD